MMRMDEAFKRFRKVKALSQMDLCGVLGIKQPQYSRYESGKREMRGSQIKAICEYYNVSADYLLGLTDEYRPLRCGEDETASDGTP